MSEYAVRLLTKLSFNLFRDLNGPSDSNSDNDFNSSGKDDDGDGLLALSGISFPWVEEEEGKEAVVAMTLSTIVALASFKFWRSLRLG